MSCSVDIAVAACMQVRVSSHAKWTGADYFFLAGAFAAAAADESAYHDTRTNDTREGISTWDEQERWGEARLVWRCMGLTDRSVLCVWCDGVNNKFQI